MEDEHITVKGEKTTYILRKPKVSDWKEYYKKRKELRQEYDDPTGETFALGLFMLERCLVEPKISIDDIPFSDYNLLSSELLQASVPHPLRTKSSPMT